MPLKTIPRQSQAPLALPAGFSVLLTDTLAHSTELRAALHTEIMQEFQLSAAQARLALIEPLDPELGLHPDPLIQAAHWGELWNAFRTTGAGTAAGEDPEPRRRLMALRAELGQLEFAEQSQGPGVLGDQDTADSALRRAQDRLAEARHALQVIDSELQREMSGLMEVPDAARQVARLGEVQSRIRGEYLQLTDQRQELAGRSDAATLETRKLKREQGQKIVLGAVFALLGFISLFNESVPGHLRPLGMLVVVMGGLWSLNAARESRKAVSPREAQLRRSLNDLDKRLADVDGRLKEADRQVRQFCGQVGCTSPGQVLELQRRYDQRQEEREQHLTTIGRLEREVEELGILRRRASERQTLGTADVAGLEPGEAPVAVALRAADLRAEVAHLEQRLADLAGHWPEPSREGVNSQLGALLSEWGMVVAAGGVEVGPRGVRLPPEMSLDLRQKLELYLAARVVLIRSAESSQRNLPLVLDDPLRFCEYDALTWALHWLQARSAEGRQVIGLTARPTLVDHWRTIARAAGTVLTVIELGPGLPAGPLSK